MTRGTLTADEIKASIREAFRDVPCPPRWCLQGSHEGTEPFLVSEEFAELLDWRSLSANFLDQAPQGYATALAFFSDEAFHFYLPAYLIADLDGALKRVDPTFYLCHGLDDESKNRFVNRRRYGERTWFQVAQHKFAMFNQSEAKAIVAYLRHKAEHEEVRREFVESALKNYWLARAGEASGKPEN
jgi:hypothetical protein